METLVQVFDDDYHLKSLNSLLEASAKLLPEVNVKAIVVLLMDKLVAFVNGQDEADLHLESTNLFEVFWTSVTNMINVRDSTLLHSRFVRIFRWATLLSFF
jgi:vacuolar protein sorting-associated protein 35